MNTKLAYIISAGHSGSTLLDMLVGNIPDAFSTGEFTYLPWQLFRAESAGPDASQQKLCSCGQGFHQCPVWVDVLQAVSNLVGFNVFDEPLRFTMNLMQNEKYATGRFSRERFNRAAYTIASSNSIFLPVTNIYRSSLANPVSNNWLIIDQIAKSLSKNIIVDSSKSALRFKLLQERRPADTYAIILMRDIRGVCYSGQKRDYNVAQTAQGWVRQYNRIFSVLRGIRGLKVLGVRYEDMVENPAAEQVRIAAFLGYPDISPELNINTKYLHLVAGNKTRYSGDITFRPDYGWQDNLPRETQEAIMRIRAKLNPKVDRLFDK
jgi:hypothetical protein